MARADPRLRRCLILLALLLFTNFAFADGMVMPELVYPKVQIPNQRALIHFANGLETLVIETSFLGQGTNFAWIVPLPSVPEIKPASETLFTSLTQMFKPTLVHRVQPYYAGFLFVLGLASLGARSLRDETTWLRDLPLIVLVGAGAGLVGGHWAFGIVAATLALCIRLFARSPAIYAFLLLLGLGFGAFLVFIPGTHGFGLVQTMGGSDELPQVEVAGVRVLSVQHAGLFDIATIEGDSPTAVLSWLEKSGFCSPASATPALQDYVNRRWVFVTAKTRRQGADMHSTSLHPLAFTFATKEAVYPTQLTAVENGSCTMELFVFGERRGTAPHFHVLRCERVVLNPRPPKRGDPPALRISEPELMGLVGNSKMGTRLWGTLTAAQMKSDVIIGSSFLGRKGSVVFSQKGAFLISLNATLPLAGLALLMLSANSDRTTGMRRKRTGRGLCLLLVLAFGVAVFVFLPKVEIEIVPAADDYATQQRVASLCPLPLAVSLPFSSVLDVIDQYPPSSEYGPPRSLPRVYLG